MHFYEGFFQLAKDKFAGKRFSFPTTLCRFQQSIVVSSDKCFVEIVSFKTG
jgi:hypothetical protein